MSNLKLFFFICLLILVIFSINFASAQYQYEFTRYIILADVGVDKVTEEITLTIKNLGSPMSKIEYIVGGKVFNVKVSDSAGTLSFNVTKMEQSSIISCYFRKPIEVNEEYTLTLSFQTTSFIGKIGENSLFQFNFAAPTIIRNFTAAVRLPEYIMRIYSVSPKANIRYDLESYRFIIEWNYNDLSAGWEFLPNIVFGLKQKPPFRLGLYEFIAFIVFAFIAGVLALYAASRFYYRIPKEERIGITLTVLKEDEKKAIEALLAAGGKITQRELQDKIGFSKAKVSRLVFDLEKRGVIKKDRTGRTNILILSEDFFKPKLEGKQIAKAEKPEEKVANSSEPK